ncbi:hypothetical protein ACFQNE_11525 [Gordonia phosphorivorans]|uniref:ATPase BadF/BadG/BcrA/BcrD type domain-containing protein n=1 Tax=Gordonia phosphorivorans TaxID=1056982 RepID=A0ABV6HAY0_9ACTN
MTGKKLACVIADSGGTKTSWAFVYLDNSRVFFDTKSYHPVNFCEAFFGDSKQFLESYITTKVPLYFFGAGMGKLGNRQVLHGLFRTHFSSVAIFTDIQGVVHALDMKSGVIAVMGTGSVLVEVHRGSIRRQVGGRGHLLGDEGSAYYFGKLVLAAYSAQQLTEKQVEDLASTVDIQTVSRKEQLTKKYETANLAKVLDSELFEPFHRRNIQLFLATHIDGQMDTDELVIVGSYAYFNRVAIAEELRIRRIENVQFINNPIELICERLVGPRVTGAGPVGFGW